MEFSEVLSLICMGYIRYNKRLKQYSRDLRNDSTYAEVLLWLELRAGNLRGYKFNRQKPLGNYIADFYCKKLKLVIEVDGITHINGEQHDRDNQKDTFYHDYGLHVIRVDDNEIRENISLILEIIEEYIDEFESRPKSGESPASR